jgi:hypothetical protein
MRRLFLSDWFRVLCAVNRPSRKKVGTAFRGNDAQSKTWSMMRDLIQKHDALEHRAKKWVPVFRDKRCSIKNLEHDA